MPQKVYLEGTAELGVNMHAMVIKKIIKANVGYKEIQLKALLILEGGQKVVFKTKRYSHDYVIEGNHMWAMTDTMQKWKSFIWPGSWVSSEPLW